MVQEAVGGVTYLLPITTEKKKNQLVINILFIQIMSFPDEKDQYVYVRKNMKGEATGRATHLLPVTAEKYNW